MSLDMESVKDYQINTNNFIAMPIFVGRMLCLDLFKGMKYGRILYGNTYSYTADIHVQNCDVKNLFEKLKGHIFVPIEYYDFHYNILVFLSVSEGEKPVFSTPLGWTAPIQDPKSIPAIFDYFWNEVGPFESLYSCLDSEGLGSACRTWSIVFCDDKVAKSAMNKIVNGRVVKTSVQTSVKTSQKQKPSVATSGNITTTKTMSKACNPAAKPFYPVQLRNNSTDTVSAPQSEEAPKKTLQEMLTLKDDFFVSLQNDFTLTLGETSNDFNAILDEHMALQASEAIRVCKTTFEDIKQKMTEDHEARMKEYLRINSTNVIEAWIKETVEPKLNKLIEEKYNEIEKKIVQMVEHRMNQYVIPRKYDPLAWNNNGIIPRQ